MGNRRAAAAPDERMRRFEQELEELANQLKVQPYIDHTQSELASDLAEVRSAVHQTLKVLRQIQIVDNPEPTNVPLFHALLFGLNRRRAEQGLPPLNGTDFPATVVGVLIELQEAAETALATNGSRRGNSSHRTHRTAHIARAAMAFVLRYRGMFGDWPPMSNDGPAIEAMRTFLENLGFSADVDPAGVLKRTVAKERKAERKREAWSRTHF